MRALLEILSGHQASLRIRLTERCPLKIGRGEPSDLRLPQDSLLAELHFSLEFDGAVCHLHVPPGGTAVQIEGRPETRVNLTDGSIWVAGQTWFCLHMKPSAQVPREYERIDPLLKELRATPTPLFALLDAARDERVVPLLRSSGEESQSLYEGLQGQILAAQAPYLIRLTPDSDFLPCLLQQAWGRSWGILFSSQRPFAELRRHFRRFLFARDDAGREVFLRFYDPRVLRSLLPVLLVSQARAFFEGIEAFLLEGPQPWDLLRFTTDEQGLVQRHMEIPVGQ